ncbi:MAG TPA: sulfatase [Candidatus Binatia bacterium]|nr:sulfatase [Candidatus Binatia bacterium]
MPQRIRTATRLLLSASARDVDGKWRDLEEKIVTVERNAGGMPTVRTQYRLSPGGEPTKIPFAVEAIVLPAGSVVRAQTSYVSVPKKATLEFGIGVLEKAWASGRVRFGLQACTLADCKEVFAKEVDPGAGESGRWQDGTVDLRGYGGQEISFILSAEALDADRAGFTLPAWADLIIRKPVTSEAAVTRMILISLDTLRADHVSSYGYRFDTAPFMAAKFGGEGVVFEQCLAAASATSPSHMTMFTGLQPMEHGMLTGMGLVSPRIAMIAEELRKRGVSTAAATEDGWLNVNHGFGRGFDLYIEDKSADIMNPEGHVESTFASGLKWLARNLDRPFFLFLHTFQVHTPYAPPPAYQALYENNPDIPVEEGRVAARLYDQEIRYVDDQLRSLFEGLEKLGLADSTFVIVTSDHGEAFFEHGYSIHGAEINEEVARVPFLVVGPGVAAGKRVKLPVAHIDIAPTIAHLFDVPFPQAQRGRSLAGLLTGTEDEAVLAQRFYVTESWGEVSVRPGSEYVQFHPPAFAVRRDGRKAITYRDGQGGTTTSCYDLGTDPGERSVLKCQGTKEFEDLMAYLDEYQVKTKERRQMLESGRAQDHAMDPREEEKLRSLGYLD